jgi:nitric oxide reductase large subunit
MSTTAIFGIIVVIILVVWGFCRWMNYQEDSTPSKTPTPTPAVEGKKITVKSVKVSKTKATKKAPKKA